MMCFCSTTAWRDRSPIPSESTRGFETLSLCRKRVLAHLNEKRGTLRNVQTRAFLNRNELIPNSVVVFAREYLYRVSCSLEALAVFVVDTPSLLNFTAASPLSLVSPVAYEVVSP